MPYQPPHKTSALDGNLPDDFSPFEARLAGLIPVTNQVNRDEIMFQAGRTASHRQHRRTMRRWQAACGLLLCVSIGQWAWLPNIGDLPPHQQIAERTPSAPDEKPTQEEASPTPAATETAQVPSADESEPPSQPSPTTKEALPEPPLPSIWGLDFFVGRHQDHNQRLRRDLTGRGLSVGSPPTAVWNEPATPPQASRGPTPTPRTSRELMMEWLETHTLPM